MEWRFSATRRNPCGEPLQNAAKVGRKGLFSELRHTSSECAVKHTMSSALIWGLGRVKQVYLLSLSEEELCDREPFDQMHESMAERALP